MVNKYDIIKLYDDCTKIDGQLHWEEMIEYSRLINRFATIVTNTRKSNRWINRYYKEALELHKKIKIIKMFAE